MPINHACDNWLGYIVLNLVTFLGIEEPFFQLPLRSTCDCLNLFSSWLTYSLHKHWTYNFKPFCFALVILQTAATSNHFWVKTQWQKWTFPSRWQGNEIQRTKIYFFEVLTFYMAHESSAINMQEFLWRWCHSQAKWCNGEDLKVPTFLRFCFLKNCCCLNFKYIISYLKDEKLFCWPKLCILLVSKNCWLKT